MRTTISTIKSMYNVVQTRMLTALKTQSYMNNVVQTTTTLSTTVSRMLYK